MTRKDEILSGQLVTEIIHESSGTLNKDPNLATHQWCAARPTYVKGVVLPRGYGPPPTKYIGGVVGF